VCVKLCSFFKKILMFIITDQARARRKECRRCRCYERRRAKAEESTRLAYTGLLGELENLKIETRLIDEMFASVMGEYV
jgi:hypothetical protein